MHHIFFKHHVTMLGCAWYVPVPFIIMADEDAPVSDCISPSEITKFILAYIKMFMEWNIFDRVEILCSKWKSEVWLLISTLQWWFFYCNSHSNYFAGIQISMNWSWQILAHDTASVPFWHFVKKMCQHDCQDWDYNSMSFHWIWTCHSVKWVPSLVGCTDTQFCSAIWV